MTHCLIDMDAGLIFTNAKIKSRESELFGKDKMQRLADASTIEEATRILQEGGYPVAPHYLEMLTLAEREATEQFKECCVSGYGLECFLIMNDYHNAKVAAKRVFFESKADCFKPDGMLSVKDMEERVQKEDFSAFPTEMARALVECKRCAVNGTLTPSVIDVAVDKAAFAAVAEVKKAASVAAYFTRLADFANLATANRARYAGISAARFTDMLVVGGELTFAECKKVYDLGVEEASEKLRLPEVYRIALTKLKESTASFETYRDDVLLAPIKKARFDMFSPAAVMGMYLGKQREITNVRLLLARINNGVDKEVIKTRTREQYV